MHKFVIVSCTRSTTAMSLKEYDVVLASKTFLTLTLSQKGALTHSALDRYYLSKVQ